MQRRLPLDGPARHPGTITLPVVFARTPLNEILRAYGGATFGAGAYRIHAPQRVRLWTALAVTAFPEARGRVLCFASDWLGRQFALATEAAGNGNPGVVLLDVSSGDVLHTDRDLRAFHDELLATDPEPALAISLYAQWRASGGAIPGPEQCVEPEVPYYLGGSEDLDNLVLTDMEVSWTIGAQLLSQTRGLEPGTEIRNVRATDN